MEQQNQRAGTNDGDSRSVPSPARRYAVAVICVLTAFAIRYWLTPVLGEELPFLLFIAAALIAAWYGGAATGIVALLLGLLLASSFFLPAHRVPVAPLSLEALQFIRYFFTASLGIALIEVLHRDRRQARAALEELEREVKRRQKTEEELRQAEARLRHHAELLEERVEERTAHLAATVESLRGLLYHIAHNLRAPLRAMEGYSHLLITEHGPKVDATARDHLLHISTASKRMDELIQDLLAYGRLGHIEVTIKRVDLRAAVDEILFALQLEIQQREAVVRIDGSLTAVMADPQILKEVLANLLENAIKFVPPNTKPQVTLRAERSESEVRLWIEDNGIGIEPRFHDRIFEVFEALYPGNEQSGTGIGLAIVKQGMQRMNGAVGVESQPGAGSRFWVELPGA